MKHDFDRYSRLLLENAIAQHPRFDSAVMSQVRYLNGIGEVCLNGPRSNDDPYIPVHQEEVTAKHWEEKYLADAFAYMDRQVERSRTPRWLTEPPADVAEVYKELRNFINGLNITVVVPRNTARTKGYYDGCSRIDDEMDDLTAFIPTERINGSQFLTIQRGKHKRSNVGAESYSLNHVMTDSLSLNKLRFNEETATQVESQSTVRDIVHWVASEESIKRLSQIPSLSSSMAYPPAPHCVSSIKNWIEASDTEARKLDKMKELPAPPEDK
jgi:hypothetical protein